MPLIRLIPLIISGLPQGTPVDKFGFVILRFPMLKNEHFSINPLERLIIELRDKSIEQKTTYVRVISTTRYGKKICYRPFDLSM